MRNSRTIRRTSFQKLLYNVSILLSVVGVALIAYIILEMRQVVPRIDGLFTTESEIRILLVYGVVGLLDSLLLKKEV